ncbi:unnamed protein product [Thelazia callipaeda]|uniref:LIM zinc-binding domain-containing protein n=1 Tax=Thelazia callipaeda TaxID=103827 RepID=A0A0N5D0P4_THECL|nr:unnamed protein product [Thelazia callipaeda]
MFGRGRCAKCGEPLDNEEVIFVLGHLYHLNHLRCNYCDTRISHVEQGFILDGTKLACSRCLDNLSPKCYKCKKSIVHEYTSHDGHLYHRDCFKCARCHRVLDTEYFEDEDSRPLDRDCCWGQVLMDHIVRDIDNIVPSKY